MPAPDFDDIRKFARNLAAQSGGKINIEEWNSNGEDCMKIVLTWKQPTYKVTTSFSSSANQLT